MADKVKLLAAVALLVAGVGAFYYYADQLLWVRVAGLLTVAGFAVVIALQTERGRSTWAFFQDARNEVRKVVWPTRKETLQMTGIVIAMVIVLSLVLWGFDWVLARLVHVLIGSGS